MFKLTTSLFQNNPARVLSPAPLDDLVYPDDYPYVLADIGITLPDAQAPVFGSPELINVDGSNLPPVNAQVMDSATPSATLLAEGCSIVGAEAAKGRRQRAKGKCQRMTTRRSCNPPAWNGGARQQSTAKTKGKKQTPVLECDLPRFPCEQCGETFKRREYLRRHVRSKHENRKYKCTFCEREFGQKNNLDRHIRAKHGEEMLPESLDKPKESCDYPGCTFKSHRGADKLRDHMEKNHKGSPTFPCRLTRGERNPKPCKAFFFTAKRRKQHEQRTNATHTKPRRPSLAADE